jgi:hypothetical protein
MYAQKGNSGEAEAVVFVLYSYFDASFLLLPFPSFRRQGNVGQQ